VTEESSHCGSSIRNNRTDSFNILLFKPFGLMDIGTEIAGRKSNFSNAPDLAAQNVTLCYDEVTARVFCRELLKADCNQKPGDTWNGNAERYGKKTPCHTINVRDKIAPPNASDSLLQSRACPCCQREFEADSFPVKGGGRRERFCHDCHNKIRRSRRSRNKPPSNSVEQPSIFEVEENGVGEFVGVLFELMLNQGLMGNGDEDREPTLDELLQRSINEIDKLIL
jgi:hypothetical protein